MSADPKEVAFQQDIITQMIEGGWQLGDASEYNRERALYTSDCLDYVKTTQPKTWAKYQKLYPSNPEQAFIEKLTAQLSKADPQATDKSLRTFGTLGVLRHEIRDKSASFKLCQFKPEHGLNPETQAMYDGNILRVVPELVYSPYATKAQLAETGTQAKAWRIDLVLFLNGIPIVTMELKSEFKQSVDRAKTQYKRTRLPKDPETNKPEPLLTFKRGALVHFAVSQYEAHMTTKLAGQDTDFRPFNRGTKDGGAGNDVPDDIDTYATGYLWNEVLAPPTSFRSLDAYPPGDQDRRSWDGEREKRNICYHQWDLVTTPRQAARKALATSTLPTQWASPPSHGLPTSSSFLMSTAKSSSTPSSSSLIAQCLTISYRTPFSSSNTLMEWLDVSTMRKGIQGEKLAQALEQSQPIIIVTIKLSDVYWR